MTSNHSQTSYAPAAPRRIWSWHSAGLLALVWAVLQIGGLFTPGLLDDVDSVYIQIAREMLQRHDFVTPTIDGIRFFDKPPLMYWLAAGSMRVFGVYDWAARLPLALGMLALLLEVYALGIRFFRSVSPLAHPDRAGLYAGLAMATSIGPYLYTRFYIPDMLVALWMAVSVHLFLIALERVSPPHNTQQAVILSEVSRASLSARDEAEGPGVPQKPATSADTFLAHTSMTSSPLLPMLALGVVLALSVLTKGLIGIVFPIGFVLLYLLCAKQLRLLLKLHVPAATAAFLLVAAPWHVLAALRNPAIAMPAGLGLPARAGWTWFYLYNEHVARFLGRRIPHDYGQVPIPLFWLLLVLWLVPWAAFLPAAVANAVRVLRSRGATPLRFDSDMAAGQQTSADLRTQDRAREAALALLLWPGIVLGFFTLSSRQEYYHLPALPALALLVGGLLAMADRRLADTDGVPSNAIASRTPGQALRGSSYMMVPFASLLTLVCGYLAIASPAPRAGTDLNSALNSNPDLYNLSLGHVFDLTTQAMGFFRGPLITVALGMLVLGPISHLLRRRRRTFAANLLVAAGMTAVLLAAHEGLVRFYPILGSKELALDIQQAKRPGGIVAIDGELTSGSTLLFYTNTPVLLVNGRINGPWFGSFWPYAPHVFLDEAGLRQLWSGPQRVFLLTYHPDQREHDLAPLGKVISFAASGGKTVLTNR